MALGADAMSLVHAILGVLEAKPMNGYELAQFFDTQASWVWSAPRSQIYPQLRKMEKDGLIVAESQIRGSKLERREYSITKRGVVELREWVATPHDTTTKRDAVFLQAVLFDLVDPPVAAKILHHIIAQQQHLVDEWMQHAQRLRNQEGSLLQARLAHRPAHDHQYIADLKACVFEGSAEMAKARIQWAHAELRLIEGRAPAARSQAKPPKAKARKAAR